MTARHNAAVQLGFKSHAERVLSAKMAPQSSKDRREARSISHARIILQMAVPERIWSRCVGWVRLFGLCFTQPGLVV